MTKFLANISEALLKRKIHNRSKLLINGMLMRIETIKRRRSVMPKYFRSDIAELLRIGHDTNAFERVGRLYVYENMLLSYEFVERYCALVSNYLKVMNDQCVDECKEAASSLMYAAARFGDLPELRELRSLFFDTFGNSLESFVNKEFINLLNQGSPTNNPTKEMKIQFMQEIAQEYSVEWCGTVDDDQDNGTCIADHKKGLMVNIQETINDDSNDREKDESDDVDVDDDDDDDDDDIVKQMGNMRRRILDYISRTTSQLSTSQETSASPEECSTYSHHPTKSRSSKHGVDKENEDVTNDRYYVPKWDGEKVVTASRGKSNRWRMTGALSHAKIHPVECCPEPTAVDVLKANENAANYQLDSREGTCSS